MMKRLKVNCAPAALCDENYVTMHPHLQEQMWIVMKQKCH